MRRPSPSSFESRITLYRGKIPLVGWEPLVNSLPKPLQKLLCLHTVILIEGPQLPPARAASPEPSSDWVLQRSAEVSASTSGRPCVLLDFVPASPKDPLVIARLLTFGNVPGLVRRRRLPRVPRSIISGPSRQIELTPAEVSALLDRIEGDQDLQLRLFFNDCQTYANSVGRRLEEEGSRGGAKANI